MARNQVQLAVYDLSRGMARGLSRQILGQQIDGIWHTGIVVYGKEYYFGGGVQCTNWGMFAQMNQLPPDQVLNMGETSKTQAEFETYLRTIQHRYTNATYDLINNNCNHFANVICQFLTGHGIPEHIVDLPRIVFSTPGGAMLRPMIEGMQNNIRQQYGYGLDPFSAAPSSSASTTATAAAPPAQPFETALSSAVTAVALNALENTATLTLAELEENPLISADASTVQAVGIKILNLPDANGNKGQGLTPEEQTQFQSILSRLTAASTSPSTEFTVEDYLFLEKLLVHHPSVHMPCLFILRLMFLHDHVTDFGRLSIVREIIRRLLSSNTSQSSSSSEASALEQVNPFASVPSQVMALCALSNLLSHDTGKAYLLGETSSLSSLQDQSSEEQQHFINELIDVILQGLNHSRVEVRQMSSTLAYNLTLACTKEPSSSSSSSQSVWQQLQQQEENTGLLNPQALQLLCGCFEGIMEEKDESVRRRRLAVICRIARVFPTATIALIRELGFEDLLQIMKMEGKATLQGYSKEEGAIIEELLYYLRQ